jgi:hypothetical protein
MAKSERGLFSHIILFSPYLITMAALSSQWLGRTKPLLIEICGITFFFRDPSSALTFHDYNQPATIIPDGLSESPASVGEASMSLESINTCLLPPLTRLATKILEPTVARANWPF